MYLSTLLLVFVARLAYCQDLNLYGSPYSTTTPEYSNCSKEATSFTLVTDYPYYWSYSYSVVKLLNRISEKYPCYVRQYAGLMVDQSEITEISRTNEQFINALHNGYYSFYTHFSFNYCQHSLLLGLKKALDISPEGAFILVLSGGSIADSSDENLLNQIFVLLEIKKIQVFFATYESCHIGSLEEYIFNEIASRSYGQFVKVESHNLERLIHGLDLFLSKPLNYRGIANRNFNTTDGHSVEEFNITTRLKHLMITTSGFGNFTLFDSNGTSIKYERVLSYYKGASYLVKDPMPGIWRLDIARNKNFSVKILGFPGSCNKSKCHANATCEEFGGYQDCTCKQGFSGNGIMCNDTNECDYYWDNQCNDGYCINTIGSYVCSCYPGFVEEPGSGCVEADECANDNLNDCHALAVCTNYYGSYACSCPYGYYGDGQYCEINECQNENICARTSYCVKSNGSFSCLDPCSNYTVIDEQWRLTTRPSNINNYWYHCDNNLQGWFRFQGLQEQRIPEYCVPEHSCGTHSPMWLNGVHPTTEEGIANRTACANWAGNCCLWSSPVTISACPGGFYVYRLYGTPACHLAYCTEPYEEALNCSTAKCSSDEECKKIKGISQCHCKQDLYESNGLDSFINSNSKPNLECGSSQIKLSYSKCLLDRSGYDTSTIHLRDYSCTANIEREDISYVRIDMLPRSGSCGAELLVNESHITYMNTLYIKPKGDGIIQRGEVKVGFSCSYPLNMAVSLWIAVNPFVSTIDINIGGTGTFKATMALYQFADYTGPYEGSEVWMSTESMAYVGVMVENPGQPNLVVVMKDCYATPTAESWHPVRYSIIKNSCRNLNDPTISVVENGVSLQGRFSVQVFKFIGYYDKLYLHCQIQLCDVTTQFCLPQCSGMRSAVLESGSNLANLTLGPLRLKASPANLQATTPSMPTMSAALSSARVMTSSLVMAIIPYLLLTTIY